VVSKAVEKVTDSEAVQARWVKRVQREIRTHKDWRDQAQKAEDAFRDEIANQATNDNRKKGLFPIWWSTVQITHAAIYAKSPKPDVRKRNVDHDKAADPEQQAAKDAQSKSDDKIAKAIERALSFTIDTTGFDDHGHRVVDDFLVGACGVGRVRLATETGEAPVIDPNTQEPILGEDGQPLMQKVIKRQTLHLEHFHWSKFGWEPNKDWESCDWVRFEHDLTVDEIEERWKVDMEQGGTSGEPKGSAVGPKKQYKETLKVQEIWDRKKRRRLFICEDHPVPLEDEEDPLHLADFYPCPRPVFLNLATDKLIPKPDYMFIQSQCGNINRMTGRIQALTKQIKDVGFYDASLLELAQLESSRDGTKIPIKNLLERLNKQGKADFDQVVATQDNTGRAAVLQVLIAQRDIEKNIIFETLGIADIIRGATVASETAEAQKIKSQWGNVRLGPKIKGLALFFRDVFRIMSEIIAEHFEPEQLMRMSGVELTPEELATLKDDLTRTYAIDVETDSTIAADDAEERGQRLEMVKVLTEYLNILMPQAAQNLIPADFVKQTLLFVLASFKYGRQLEDAIQSMPDDVAQLQQLQQQLQQCQQQLEQAGQQTQQLQGELQKVDQVKMQTAQAESAREDQRVQIEGATAEADNKVKEAQAAKYWSEAATPAQPDIPEGIDPIEAEKLKISWFDAMTKRMAVENKAVADEASAVQAENDAEREAMQPEPVGDLL
jgi:hypothetical protein